MKEFLEETIRVVPSAREILSKKQQRHADGAAFRSASICHPGTVTANCMEQILITTIFAIN